MARERILVLTPQGRDGVVAKSLLVDAGFKPQLLDGLPDLQEELAALAGVVILTEEALATADLAPLNTWLSEQPAWSDMPFIVLTRQGGGLERNPRASRISRVLGNATFLERPFHPTTLISLVETALRGRRRQFEARDRLEALRSSEDRLRELNLTLEQRVAAEVAERAAAEDALRQSQKMEAVGQLTGGVAHDFNNLLTIIRSSVDLLRRPNLPEDRRMKYMDAVSDTIDRAAKLTAQLLAFARRQTLKPEVFDVTECISALADMLDPVTGARIDIVLELANTQCLVEADRSQFETAVVNIAVNARDAMNGQGKLTLCLESGKALPPIRGHAGAIGPFAVVTVSDTGTGIAEEHLQHIFEPFFTTKEIGKGTGLGLSQVFGFVKQSGGDIDVESIVGQGTAFRIYLPQVFSAENVNISNVVGPDETHGGDGDRVLVVEDNIEIGQFASQILEDLGYSAIWAKTAEAALRILETEPVNILFSDVVMPGMGGIELSKRVHSKWPKLPIVLTSGYSHELAQEGSQGLNLLKKPYSATQLALILKKALRQSAQD